MKHGEMLMIKNTKWNKQRIYLHGKNIYKERNDSSQGDRFKESSLLTFKFQSILYLHLTL